MAYLPFARKYRPQTFADLVGQSHITQTLTRALEQQRVGQAYLFAGLRGVGKTSAARILAKCLNCERGQTPTPCQQCASCIQITQGNSLDVTEIDGASHRGIDEIRALRETVGFAPAAGAFHVYIIDEVHMLTAEAFNALLKTLEEPPAHVKFIFATTAPHKVPATILSRCQRFDFRRLEATTIVEALRGIVKAERLTADDGALYAIARAAEGSLRDAEVILDQLASFAGGAITERDVAELLGLVESDGLLAWAQAILARDPAAALELLARQVDQGREPAALVVSLARHLRNLLVTATVHGGEQAGALARLVDEPPERLARLREQAGLVPAQDLLMMLQVLNSAYEMIRRSPLGQAVLELTVIKLATREAWQSLDAISRQLEQLSGSTGAGPEAVGSGRSTDIPAPAEGREPSADAPERAARRAVRVPEVSARAAEELTQPWAQFLERLGTQKMSLAAYLADAKPLRLAEGRLAVGLPTFALHQEVLNVLENRRLIERLLGDVLQAGVIVEYEVLSKPVAGEDDSELTAAKPETLSIVGDIVKLFNATLVEPPRPA